MTEVMQLHILGTGLIRPRSEKSYVFDAHRHICDFGKESQMQVSVKR